MAAATRDPGTGAGRRALLILGLIFVITFSTAGLYKALLETLLPHSAWLQDQLRIERLVDEPIPPGLGSAPGSYRYDLGRAGRRHLLLVALVLLIALRRRLPWADAARHGFSGPARWSRIGYGLALATGLVICYSALLLLSGQVQWDPPAAGYLAGKTLEYLLAAALIAALEELFFRGLLFGSMMRDWGVARGPAGNPLRREAREIVPDVRIGTKPQVAGVAGVTSRLAASAKRADGAISRAAAELGVSGRASRCWLAGDRGCGVGLPPAPGGGTAF